MTSHERGARLPGLDTLRALAIALVFMHHYRIFVSGTPSFGWVSEVGWVGVDLFFVLSGYLIADSLLVGLVRGERLSLPAFYARRALRTLPVFWVVLALYFLFPAQMGGKPPPPLWRFLTFTQNFGLQPGTALSHAWSLCVEEQFYLVLPMVLSAGVMLGFRRRHGWALIAALMALAVVARSLLWRRYGLESGGQLDGYHPHLYYATLGRFDEFLPGVAVALFKHGHPRLWARTLAQGNRLLAVGGVATSAVIGALLRGYYVDGVGYGYAMTAFGYPLVACAFAVLVLAALSPACGLARARIPGARTLAVWSYAIYLSHKAVDFIVPRWLAPLSPTPVETLLAVTITCLLVGCVLHKMVEAPFMAWRSRWVPSHFSAPRCVARASA